MKNIEEYGKILEVEEVNIVRETYELKNGRISIEVDRPPKNISKQRPQLVIETIDTDAVNIALNSRNVKSDKTTTGQMTRVAASGNLRDSGAVSPRSSLQIDDLL